MDSELRERKALEQDLHHALQRGELELHYQPQIDLATPHHGRGRGAAALASSQARADPARPLHPARRGQRPDPADRRLGAGAGLPAGQALAARRACRSCACRSICRRSSSAIPTWPASVRGVLERSGLAPDRLELEITERVLMEDTETNLATLRELKQLGVKISIDDFGVGHSSLGYLRRFPFDEIKLDRSFVAALEHDPSAAAIVRATLEPRSQPRPRRGRRGRRERRAACDARCRGLSAGAGLLLQPAGARAGDRPHGQGAGRGQAGCRRGERLTGWPRGCSAAQALLAGAGNHFQPAGAVAGDRRGGVRDGPGIGGAVGQRGAETDGPADGWLGAERPCQPADAVPGSRRGRRQARALAADSARVDRCGGGCGAVVGNAGRCPASAPAGRPAVVTRVDPRRSSPRPAGCSPAAAAALQMATLPSARRAPRNSRPRQMRAQRGRWDLQAPAAPADAVVLADAALLPEADHVAPERLGCLEKNRGGLLGGHRETGVVLSQTDLTQGVAGPPRWSRSGQRRRCWLARGCRRVQGPYFSPQVQLQEPARVPGEAGADGAARQQLIGACAEMAG